MSTSSLRKIDSARQSSIPPQPETPPQQPEAWGRQVARRLAVFVGERQPAATRLWERIAARRALIERIAPLAILACVMLFLAYVHYREQRFYISPGIAGFAEINTVDAARLGISPLAVNSQVGYDGQFFYYLAYKPSLIWTCVNDHAHCPTYDPAFRWQRVFYPMAARVFALGQPALLPYTLLLINFISILVAAYLIGAMAVEMGASRWMGLAAGLFCGELLGFLRDLADPVGVVWVIVAVYLMRHQRPFWSAAAAAAALLTREALIFYVPIVLLPLLAQRRWRTLAQAAAIMLLPFIAWQSVLRALYGSWPLIAGDTKMASLTSIPLPFLGLWHTHHDFDFAVTLLCAGIPLALAMFIALAAIWQRGPRDLLRDPVPLMVLVYSLLFSLVGPWQWADVWGGGRLVAPGVVLGVVVASSLPWRSLRASYSVVLALTAFAPFIEFVR